MLDDNSTKLQEIASRTFLNLWGPNNSRINLIFSISTFQQHIFGHRGAEILDLGAFRPSPGRIFHVDSEFAVENAGFQRPEA